jgi:hypothetical protein
VHTDQAKATVEKEAAQKAKRRAAADEAAELIRKKASDWATKLVESRTSSSEDKSPLLSFFGGASQERSEASGKPSPELAAVDSNNSTLNFLSFLMGNNKDESDSPPATKSGSESTASKTAPSEDKSPLLNFFASGTKKNSDSAASTKASGAKSPSPAASSTFSFFGGSKDDSIIPGSPAKPQKPRPSIAIKKAGGDSTASAFSSQKPRPSIAIKKAEGDSTASVFSSFGGSQKKKDQSGAKPSVKAPPASTAKKAEATFSFFGGSKQTNDAAADSTSSVLPKNSRPTLSIKKAKEPIAREPKKDIPAKKSEDRVVKRATFSLSPWLDGIVDAVTGTKRLPSDAIPILEKWNQNADGSITGVVSNSLTYQDGASITTSPVKKGAKPGTIATTSSGSQYRLLDFDKSKVRKEVPVIVGDNYPLLSDWSTQSDGCVTGCVSNSKEFRKGTEITTSPIKRGTTAPGSIVTTQSGKQYRLGNKRPR